MALTDVELAIAAAEAGASVLRARFGTELHRIEKGPLDFATDADVRAEAAILGVLRAARAEDALIGEESGESVSAPTDRTWLVDPLCGTLNYAAQTPLVAVNVALRVGTEITAAVCADPFAREVMWTDGTRAGLRRAGESEPLRPSAQSGLVDVNLDPPFPNAARFRAVALLADPLFVTSYGPRVSSTTLALAWVAAGRRAGYITDGHLRGSVHFSSGIALCRAAGCVVTDLDGQAVHTGAGGLVAAPDEPTHAALFTAVRRQFESSKQTSGRAVSRRPS